MRIHFFLGVLGVVLALALCQPGSSVKSDIRGRLNAAPVRPREDPQLERDRKQLEADLKKALRARYDEANEDLAIASRGLLEVGETYAGSEKGALEAAHGASGRPWTLPMNRRLRLELLGPLLVFMKKVEAHVEGHVYDKRKRQHRSTDDLHEVRGVRLEVEIEILKAKRSLPRRL